LPPIPWPASWGVDFYIDATTKQVFEDYGAGRRIGEHVKREALRREQLAYRQAGVVICMCQWAADSVIQDYGIDPAKVHVVVGGANIDDASLSQVADGTVAPPAPTPEHPLRLGFLGKDWERKGGPFLLGLADALAACGIPTSIRAIGPDPATLPAHPRLQPLGFISKKTALAKFVGELRSWHFGTLFSEAEASPRSNLECLRLGVPVIAHAVGGIASTLPDDGCGKLFSADPKPNDVATWIAARLDPYEAYVTWRAELGGRAEEFTWKLAVRQLAPLLNR
jgi:glycosyltransferase involved in cell wall biosynthesis